MADIKDRAREYLAEHSKYSEVFGQTFVAVDTMTAMIEFAEQETKELRNNNQELLESCEGATMMYKDLQKANNNLSKAKEFLREIIDTPVFNQMGGELYENEGYTELVAEAEKFLKE